MSKEQLKLENIAAGYGKEPLLSQVNLTVKTGEIMTLIGPNGSGKSTILKNITRQLTPMGGVVYLDGKDMSDMSGNAIAKSLSMVMTERVTPELMTCKDVVATGRYPYVGVLGILGKEDWEKVDAAMDMVHATEVKEKSFLGISDGQRQRVMLARALCQDTKVLILDEPTSYLDMRYKLDILCSIRRLAVEKNMAVLMSLHELDLAMKISDQLACVDGTTVARIGSPEEIFKGTYIHELYGIEEKNFHVLTGGMELYSEPKEPKYFIISGGGAGIPLYYKLQRKQEAFVSGILYENDVEYETARACAKEVISASAFYPIEEELIQRAKKWIDQCERCICTMEEFGPYAKANEELRNYAKETGKLVEQVED